MKSSHNIYQWQEDAYKHLAKGLRKGQIIIYGTGRRTGKSMMTANILNAAFEDLAVKAENRKWHTTKRYARNVIRLWHSVVALGPKL